MSIFYAFTLKHSLKATALILGDDMLARVEGRLFKRAAREYEYICKLARMKAKVFVRTHVCDCEFLSRNFIPAGTSSYMVPKLGKALGRFSARANNNSGVSDLDYATGKALSYAYEFRHVAEIATVFLCRVRDLGVSLKDIRRDTLGYNAAKCWDQGGVRSILTSLRLAEKCSFDDATAFYHYRYGWFLTEVVTLVEKVVHGSEDIDSETALVLAYMDFL